MTARRSSAFYRGFKTDARTISRDIRAELRLTPTSPLDSRVLAGHLEIPFVPLSDFRAVAPGAVQAFMGRLEAQFSAVTVFDGPTRLIVFNDAHVPQRQSSDLAHELAHALLFHAPTPAINDRGAREWDATREAEASWLSGVLLVPDEAAIRIVSDGLAVGNAAREYGVSEVMMRFRIRASGAVTRVKRYRQSIS